MGVFDRVCLVDIDTQVDFVLSSGALYVPGAEYLIPVWKQVTEFGRANNLLMLATMDTHRPDDPEFADFPPHCVRGTPGQQKIPETLCADHQIIPSVRTDSTIDFDNQVILEKETLDIFTNPHAEEVFGAVTCSTFVLYGVATDYCIRIAAMGLLSRGYRVHVLSDAVQAIDSGAGERALAEMANGGAAFIQTEVFLTKVRQHLEHRMV